MPTRRGPLSLLTLLFAAGLIAGCGNSSSSSSSGDATALLKKAFSTTIASGTAKVQLVADLSGGTSQLQGPIRASLEGPFKSRGKNTVPLVDWTYNFSAGGAGLTGKIITTADNAYLGVRGQTYEVGSALYKRFLAQAQSNSSSTKSQSLASFGVKPETWLDNPKISDGGTVGSDSTKQITGTVNVEKVVRDLVKVSENAKVRSQLQKQGRTPPKVTDAQIQKLRQALSDPKFTVKVDDKNRLRQANFSTTFRTPKGSSTSTPTSGKVSFSIAFPEVDTNPTITGPANARPLQELLQQFGLGSGALGKLKTN